MLDRWGLRTIGDFAKLPEGEVASRLGESGRDLHASARGIDPRPLEPYLPPPSFSEGMELEWPLASLEPFLFVAHAALTRLVERLESHALACTRLETVLTLDPDGHDARAIQLPAPTRDVKTLLTLLRLDLEARPPGAAVAGFTFSAHPDQPRRAQLSLFGPAALSPDRLATTIARLAALLGADRVGSPRALDGHRPERFTATGYAAPPPPPLRIPPRAGRGLLSVRVLRPPVPLEVLRTADPVGAGGREGRPYEDERRGGARPRPRKPPLRSQISPRRRAADLGLRPRRRRPVVSGGRLVDRVARRPRLLGRRALRRRPLPDLSRAQRRRLVRRRRVRLGRHSAVIPSRRRGTPLKSQCDSKGVPRRAAPRDDRAPARVQSQPMTLEELEAEAMKLEPAARAVLIRRLSASLASNAPGASQAPPPPPTPTDEEKERQWLQDALRRSRELRERQVQTEPPDRRPAPAASASPANAKRKPKSKRASKPKPKPRRAPRPASKKRAASRPKPSQVRRPAKRGRNLAPRSAAARASCMLARHTALRSPRSRGSITVSLVLAMVASAGSLRAQQVKTGPKDRHCRCRGAAAFPGDVGEGLLPRPDGSASHRAARRRHRHASRTRT